MGIDSEYYKEKNKKKLIIIGLKPEKTKTLP